ncbi:MAG TPA: 3D domain-containing protein [Chthoniobacterales bacterium]|jgi:3D (Asp-Asp-Asp) domain-containing protein
MIQRKALAASITVFILATFAGLLSRPVSASTSRTFSGPRIEGVKTTAYSASIADNGNYGAKNALGTPLKTGAITSAAADWSRYPVGTRFRIVETGREYIVDDYGSALVGTGTIDLYKTSDAQVDRWGVRHVTIEILEWGSPERSLRILQERGKMRHIRSMVASLVAQESA